MAAKLDENLLSHHIQMQAEQRPEHRVFTFEREDESQAREVTYEDLWVQSNRLASYWQERGLQKGERVAILMRNYPEFVYSLIASAITGVVSVPIDPRTRGNKLAFQLRDSEAKMAICTPDLVPRLAELEGTLLESTLVHTPAWEARASGDYTDMNAMLAQDRPLIEQQVFDITTPHQIVYTSGTTGDPKGIVLDLMRALVPKMLTVMLMKIEPDDAFYTGLSLTHGNAQTVTCLPAIWLGNHAVFSERFTKRRLWDICRKYDCTTFSNLGGILAGLYAEPPQPNDADNPVRVVNSAGTPRAIWEAFEERFDVKIHEFYGTMEGGLAHKPPGEGPVGSFGKPMAGVYQMKVVDEQGHECKPGEIGELIARPASGGPAEVAYHNNPEASKKKTEGGWLRTGDMVHQDADGYLFFEFRKGGGLRHNGDFVHPDFVERAIAEHPDVDDVFVYGVPAASGAPGERDVVAAIVVVPGAELEIASLYDKCRTDLEPNFVPTYLQVVDEIPKTISEKPQERFLREAFAPDADNVFTEPS